MNQQYPQSYIDYLVHFHGDRDYFECHEILEDYWKENTPMERDSIWVGWIQLAVALYHQRRNNFSGAGRMIEKALDKFRLHYEELKTFGIDCPFFMEQLQELKASIQANTPYTSMQLPITDIELKQTCRLLSTEKGFIWGKESDLKNPMITDRHRLRDRQEVVLLREKELNRRKNRPASY
ncbi:DUF309 domain-containing protein [Jeotgalibacillus campisalis]|uniref:DUF309 domain-containing protein n=1 Tax=Jeotgalibacillus campisalis TaxID=220754 RepID=A0A0C2VVV0_9BACL|nr:DUF309 domain-containing protein [Jeotgalibacillus campisalis]KIL48113.1 hypothetical protein KR50_22800 [Jeotgalibacillus campisalis]